MSQFGPNKLRDFFRYYDHNNAKHRAAADLLQGALPAELANDKAPWVLKFREGRPAPAPQDLRLSVPYYAQGDSDTNQGWRMCFSSSCAMLLAHLRPNALKGPGQPDDQYLRRVQQYGDTIDAGAQVRALRHFGLTVEFRSNLDWDDVDSQLARGIPVPIGVLHHGDVANPTGDGHWICVIGRSGDGRSYFVHDPAGEMDLVGGGYGLGRPGREVRYSRGNLGRRWMVDGPSTGWGIWVSRA